MNQTLTDQWFKPLGLTFDPFDSLDSANDSRLSGYLVENKALSAVRGDWPAIVSAPPGGGKTALRVQLTQDCFVDKETIYRPFPLSYTLPYLAWGRKLPELDDHIIALSRQGSLALLLFLAYRPHWFLRLSKEEKLLVRQALEYCLPSPISVYLEPCRETGTLNYINALFQPAFLPPDHPEAAAVLFWSNELEHTQSSSNYRLTPQDRWRALVDVIKEILRFPSIYICLDGVDAAPFTVEDPNKTIKYLDPLFDKIPAWSEQRIFMKAFVPNELVKTFDINKPDILRIFFQVDIQWASASLIELINRRVSVASLGLYESLIPLCSPAIQNIEIDLAETILPLPREMLVITQRILKSLVNRNGVFITPEDVSSVKEWYNLNRPRL